MTNLQRLSELKSHAAAPPGLVSPLLAGLRTGAQLDAAEFPELNWAVEGLLPEGLSLLAGSPKGGKSWLCLSLGLSIASGGKALGRLETGPARPCLYLALEDSDRRLQARCRRLLAPSERIPENLHFLINLEAPGAAVDTIHAWLDAHGTAGSLVVVDTFGVASPRSGNSQNQYASDYEAVRRYKGITDSHPGVTLVLVHHTRKGFAADFTDSVSGTNGLAGAADSVLKLERSRQEATGLLQVTGRDVEEGRYSLTMQEGVNWVLDGDTLQQSSERAADLAVGAMEGPTNAAILRCLHDSRDDSGGFYPLGPKVISERIGQNVDTVKQALGRMRREGKVDNPKRGLYVAVQ